VTELALRPIPGGKAGGLLHSEPTSNHEALMIPILIKMPGADLQRRERHFRKRVGVHRGFDHPAVGKLHEHGLKPQREIYAGRRYVVMPA
jgi:hypothetical protein